MRARRGSRAVGVAAVVVLVGATLSGCFDVGGDDPSSDPELLAAVSLTDHDMADGSVLQLLPGGDEVAGQISLDLCFADFPSESLRVGRNQVAGTRADDADLWVSSEAILYGTPEQAEQAMDELASARAGCPSGEEVTSTLTGNSGSWTFDDPPDSGWTLPAGIARQSYAFTVTSGDQSSSGTATYLRRGRMILALYLNPADAPATVIRNAPDPERFTEVMTNRLLALPEDPLTHPDPDAPVPGGVDT